MSSFGTAGKKVDPEAVRFYLDAEAHERACALGYARRTAEIMALRSKLLKLSDEAYEQVIKLVQQLVDERPEQDREAKAKAQDGRRQRGMELLDKAAGTVGSGRAAGVSKVSAT